MAPATTVRTQPGDALIVVDVQRDFLPGGALAAPGGDAVVPPLNDYLARWEVAGWPTFATRDWHPRDHCSFIGFGGRWPPHCLAGEAGADFAPTLRLPAATIVVSKATRPEREALSGFSGTDLDALLRRASARRLIVGGLATEHSVLATVRDARARGWPVVVLRNAIRPLHATEGRRAEEHIERVGAVLADAIAGRGAGTAVRSRAR